MTTAKNFQPSMTFAVETLPHSGGENVYVSAGDAAKMLSYGTHSVLNAGI